jgi:hypothetical protein
MLSFGFVCEIFSLDTVVCFLPNSTINWVDTLVLRTVRLSFGHVPDRRYGACRYSSLPTVRRHQTQIKL